MVEGTPVGKSYEPAQERMADKDVEHVFKILLIGDPGVGKTSILNRFLENRFDENPEVTQGVEALSKTLNVEGVVVKLKIWDTAGQERMGFLTSSYYRGAHGILVVFDLMEKDTFENISNWIGEIQRYAVAKDPPVKLLLGNKVDLTREGEQAVSSEEAKELVEKDMANPYIGYVETSAKDGIFVNECFEELAAELVLRHRNKKNEGPSDNTLNLNESPSASKKKEKKGGCHI